MKRLLLPSPLHKRRYRALGILGSGLILLVAALVAALILANIVAAQDDLDFGDAPDPTYPTTAANNGASHVIIPGFSLGPSIDAEPEGNASVNADGDDTTGTDDEDGVTFQSIMIPGMPACINVNLVNTASMANPSLDAWIDFNSDGFWDPVAEHLWGGASQPLAAGSNILCFTVPPNTSRGYTYARFRLSDGGGAPPTGPGSTPGEVEDYRIYIEFTKWEQPPQKRDPHDICYWGWDEISVYGDGENGNPGYPIIADDWKCEDDRPVTDIHWWGSYDGWYDNDPPYEPPPARYRPIQFHIGIWKDVPANPPGEPFSHPAELIHEWIVNYADLHERYAGCDYYSGTMQTPDTCFYYDFEIPREDWFYQNPEEETVYWISISAIYQNNQPPQQYLWGWKTRKPEWNDDAVRIFTPDAPRVGDPYVNGEPIETQEEGSWDTSFVLTSLPTEPRPPLVNIEITNTTTAKLSWQHILKDIYNAPVTINRYDVYRDTKPYQGASATLLTTIDGPFSPGDIVHLDAGAVGSSSQNYYYYVQAAVSDRYGGDVRSQLSNHVGEFDFTLVPGSS